MFAMKRFTWFASMILIVGLTVWPHHARAAKRAAFVLDATSGRTLYARNGHARRYPASLTKMMTLYLLFEDIEGKRVSLDTRFRVSKHAAAQAPVKLWLKPGDTISARDAIRAVVTVSANDVAATIAENLGGSEPAFARRMTRTAHRLGMGHTQFRNASGLPARGQYTTAHDMALLGAALQARFPKLYRFFRTTRFAWRGRVYRDHNHLLHRFRSVDGIKTGYTRASGFNIVTSYRRGGRKMIVAVMGGATWRARDARTAALVKRYSGRLARGRTYYAGLMARIRRAEPVAVPRPKPVVVASAAPATAAVAAVATAAAAAPDVRAFSFRVADDVSVRVGALPTREAATALLAKTKPVVKDMLAGARPLTKRVDVKGSVYFRAVYAGFSDVDAAQAACSALKRHHFACYAAVRPASLAN